jgi:drug/metabolite transporter (DMT)-like permease
VHHGLVPVFGLLLAAAASLALNGSFALQHAGAGEAPPVSPRRPVAAVRGLLAQPIWAAGLLLGCGGWALHIAALAHAPLSLVQSVVAAGLAVVAPLAVLLSGAPILRRELAGVAVMIAGLVAVLAGLHERGAHGRFHGPGLAAYLLACAAVAALLARRGADRAEALGAAGGVLYGAADVAIKGITGLAARNGWAVALLSPWTAAAALLTAGAFFAFQRGMQRGRPVPVIALMTTAGNVISVLGGLVVFGDPLGHAPALHAAGFGAVALATAALAPASEPSVRLTAPSGDGLPGGNAAAGPRSSPA